MKRARIIYNPTSGREAIKKNLPDVLEILENAGYETSTHATTGEGDAIEAAKLAVERRYDLVVAASGEMERLAKWLMEWLSRNIVQNLESFQ